METNTRIMDQVSKHLEHYKSNFKNDWFGIFLRGSQNYNLDYEDSDVDTLVIAIPKFEDIVQNRRPISTTLMLQNGEHVDVKDIRLVLECWKKQNISFLEILFTDYYIINPNYKSAFSELLNNREAIVRYDNYAALHCMVGTIYSYGSKLNACTGHTNPEHEKDFGKYLYHIERIYEFLEKYINSLPYSECLKSNNREYLIALKKNQISIDEAISIGYKDLELVEGIIDSYKQTHEHRINQPVELVLLSMISGIMMQSILMEDVKVWSR